MHLLEREDVIRTLLSHVGALEGGRGALLCLTGEAGIGKTSLAQFVAEKCTQQARVLWGACEDLSTPAPLAPVLDFAREGNWRLPRAKDRASQIVFFETVFEQLTCVPTLAILEDLHWADDATLDFVRFAARRLRTSALLFLVTARDDSVSAQSRLRRVLADVPVGQYERIELQSLSQETVRRIAAEHGRDGSAVFELTSGNPFLTMEILKEGSERPTTVTDALLWRADKLSAPARAALDAASIFPRRVEREVLEEVCEGVGDGVQLCVESGLLRANRDFLSFRHEIARKATEDALAPSLRLRLNEMALGILRSRRGVTTARLVHHAIEARSIEAIGELAPLAANEAARAGAHRAAVDHLRDALDYADGVETGRKAELRERLGYELQLTGEINAAIEEFGLALLLRQELEDGLKVGDDLRWLSRLHYNAGARLRGEELGRRAIDVLAPIGQTFELAMAYANLALIRALRDDSWGAIELANNTKAIAEELGHTELLADAHSTLAIANQWLDLPSSRNHFESALKLASACHRPELVARIHMNAGGVEMNARSNKAARRWLELGVQYCDERDLSTWAIYMKGLLSDLLVREGKCIEGEALGHEALEMATTTVQRFPCSAALARLLIRRGDTAGALLENLQFDAEPQRVMVYAPILGERAWLLNLEIDTSISVLNQAGAVARQIGNVWAAGEIEYWQAKLEHRQPIASEHVAAPFAHLFNGDWANAARIWSDLEAPYERALALLEGDEPACDEALRVLDRLGASAAGARARRDLRVKGRRGLPRGPRQATRSNVAGLTRREMDVLLLLEEGISNAEIAQRLSTAQKTVDHHVSAILSKLGSSTRLEAVAKARRLNLFGDQSSS